MLIPIGDEPNDHTRFPWVNYGLIAVNALVFVAVVAPLMSRGHEGAYEWTLRRWGYVPADASLTTFVTHMFMHADWMHLIGNMLFLWIFGDNVEARLGHVGYLAAYLVVGIASVVTYSAFNVGSIMPLVGASGAISGVQGLYFVACPGNRVKLFVFFYYFIRVVLVPARLVMLFWFVLQDLVPVVIGRGILQDNVAHFAHLGGVVAGLALMLALKPVLSQRYPERWTCDSDSPHSGSEDWRPPGRYRPWQ